MSEADTNRILYARRSAGALSSFRIRVSAFRSSCSSAACCVAHLRCCAKRNSDSPKPPKTK